MAEKRKRAENTTSRLTKPFKSPLNTRKNTSTPSTTSLDIRIRKTKNEIDTLKQAHSLTTSTTDADLEELIKKWQIASQAIAEELFGTVKERVCRMGGVGAWREMERAKRDRMNGWAQEDASGEVDDDADCEFDEDGEELPEDEQEYRKGLKRQAREEARQAADPPDEQPAIQREVIEDGAEDESFTMGMMLKSLHVELEVIGWNPITGKWD